MTDKESIFLYIFVGISVLFLIIVLFVAVPQIFWQSYQTKKPLCEKVGISDWQCFWTENETLNFRIQKQLKIELNN